MSLFDILLAKLFEDNSNVKLEPILIDDENSIYPIKNKDIFTLYKQLQKSYWTMEEIKLAEDKTDWKKLTEHEQNFIKSIIAFFANADEMVNKNLFNNFINEIKIKESGFFFALQSSNEVVHQETYNAIIDAIITDNNEKQELFNAVRTLPLVTNKAKFINKWMEGPGDVINYKNLKSLIKPNDVDDITLYNICKSFNKFTNNNDICNRSICKRLIAFICVEGILFSASFCALFWLKEKAVMYGTTSSNEFISRDEGLHVDHLSLLYSKLQYNKEYGKQYAEEIVKEAVEIEIEFINCALPNKLIGMNAELLIQYVKFIADYTIVNKLGYEKIYNVENPFDFMKKISLQGKTNFFERRVTEYSSAKMLSNDMTFDENF